jgi:hypothetical protein
MALYLGDFVFCNWGMDYFIFGLALIRDGIFYFIFF